MAIFQIAVCGRKGGVGKTTTASCLGSLLAYHGQKVLAVDLDPQNNLALVLGVSATKSLTYDLLTGKKPKPELAQENLYVLAGSQSLLSQEIQCADQEELFYQLQDYYNYDIIIFDCPPGSDHLERLAVVASNIALICTEAHTSGIVGAERIIAGIKKRLNRKLLAPKHRALVFTRINRSRQFDIVLPDQMAKKHPEMRQFLIGQNSDFLKSTGTSTPFMEFRPGVKARTDIEVIARWIYKDTVTKQKNLQKYAKEKTDA